MRLGYTMVGGKHPLQQMVLGKLDIYMWEHQTRLLSHTTHKNKFEMD